LGIADSITVAAWHWSNSIYPWSKEGLQPVLCSVLLQVLHT